MQLTATCATCGKAFKSLHLALPAELPSTIHGFTPTLNNCRHCGARGAHVSEVREALHDGR